MTLSARWCLPFILLIAACQSPAPVPQARTERQNLHKIEASGKKYAISTQGEKATEAAAEIMKAGGNLIDASIAASFVIAVERPHSTGISGGGFFIYHEAATGRTHAIDFRERAPHRATKNMFLNSKGEAEPQLSRNSILSVGVPGFVAGFYEIHQKFGKLPWAQLLEPAIRLAEEGFPIYPDLAEALKKRAPVLREDPSARAIFLNEKNEPWPLGHHLVQKDLARSLRLIALNGKKGFYEGPIKDSFINLSQRLKGRLTEKDFQNVRIVWREPLVGHFKDYKVVSMPPPSSGGVHVIQFLNLFDQENLKELKPLSPEAIHLAASGLQMSFADRARYLGDPDFVDVPVTPLISKEYAIKRRAEILPNKARPSSEVQAGAVVSESPQTTHLSMIDADGNAVATTHTINGWMGAGLVVPGTGIVLNNEMDDFSAKPGDSNLFGAIGSDANAIAPLKTPLSSMSPTLLFKNNQAVMAVGAPGGTRIISCVAQTILNYAGFGLPLRESVLAIRYHHQWQPDVLELEPPGPSETTVQKLQEMGHKVKLREVHCRVMAAAREGKTLKAVSDPRDIGTSAAE